MSCFVLGEVESVQEVSSASQDTHTRTLFLFMKGHASVWRNLNLGFWVQIETDYVFAKGDISEVTSVTGRSRENQSTQRLSFIIATSICWASWQMLWWLKEVSTYWLFTVPLTRNLDTVDTQSGHASSGCENLDLILHNDPPHASILMWEMVVLLSLGAVKGKPDKHPHCGSSST